MAEPFWCAECQTTCEDACGCEAVLWCRDDVEPCLHCGSDTAPFVNYTPSKEGGHGIIHAHYQVTCNRLQGGCGASGACREQCIDAMFFWNLRPFPAWIGWDMGKEE